MKPASILFGLTAGLLFGIATPFNKIMLSQLNGFQLAGLLYLGAALTFFPFIVKNRRREIISLRQSGSIRQLFGIVVSGGILAPLFLMLGLKTSNATSVSIWLNMELAATAVLGAVLFKDYITRSAAAGVVLSLIAGLLAAAQESGSGILSGLFILIACCFWGLDNNLTAIVDGVSPKTITFIKGFFGGLTNLTIGMIFSGGTISLSYIPPALAAGIVSYGVSIFLYISSARSLGATRSQMLFMTAPFWGIIASHLFLGEPLSLIIAASFLLMLAGIVLTNLSSHSHRHFHKSILHSHYHIHDEHHNHAHSSDSEQARHSHEHEHKELAHSHDHYPDTDHRHDH